MNHHTTALMQKTQIKMLEMSKWRPKNGTAGPIAAALEEDSSLPVDRPAALHARP